MEELFIKASRSKLRFETAKGNIGVEHLWDLGLVDLNSIAIAVNKKLKESADESFIAAKSTGDATLELRLEVLKYVIRTKQAEAEARAQLVEKQQEVKFLKDLLEKKKINQLEGLTIEEIEARLAKAQA